jgi:hypothetical protein
MSAVIHESAYKTFVHQPTVAKASRAQAQERATRLLLVGIFVAGVAIVLHFLPERHRPQVYTTSEIEESQL